MVFIFYVLLEGLVSAVHVPKLCFSYLVQSSLHHVLFPLFLPKFIPSTFIFSVYSLIFRNLIYLSWTWHPLLFHPFTIPRPTIFTQNKTIGSSIIFKKLILYKLLRCTHLVQGELFFNSHVFRRKLILSFNSRLFIISIFVVK